MSQESNDKTEILNISQHAIMIILKCIKNIYIRTEITAKTLKTCFIMFVSLIFQTSTFVNIYNKIPTEFVAVNQFLKKILYMLKRFYVLYVRSILI